MILEATSDSTRLVQYEWTINGVIDARTTQTIDVDVASPDVVSARAKNDCGNWSQPITLNWGVPKPEAMNTLLIVAILAAVVLMMK